MNDALDPATRDEARRHAQSAAWVALARHVGAANYRFVTVTPETHRRVYARRVRADGADLRDVFGWNLPFDPEAFDARLRGLLLQAGIAEPANVAGLLRSRVRFATLDGLPYLHSGFPTGAADAVFFGPDTYRFVEAIAHELSTSQRRASRVLDVGCGGGAGGLMAARLAQRAGHAVPRIELVDINPRALAFAQVNAAVFGLDAQVRQADLYAGTQPGVDLIVANPPYLVDAEARLYRHGGGPWGSELSRRIVAEGLPLLSAGGTLLLYTGSPIVAGRDLFFESVRPAIDDARFEHHYREIDPDVFGEELDRPAYHEVERIAAVCLVIRARRDRP